MSTDTKSRRPCALVTGASQRIGAATAELLHERGCDVIIHYNSSASQAAELAGQLNQARPGSAHLAQADLTAHDGPQRLADQVKSFTTGLSLLVNNASRFYPTTIGEVSPDTWKDLMGSNVRGPFFLTQALLDELQGGAVVNILDIHARRPMPRHAVYSMAKAALEMMTYALARELGPSIRVNGVAPGAILWPQQDLPDAEKEAILSRTVMQRLGKPEDIARAVVFLGLDADYVTGQVLAVDGGRSLNM